MNYEGLLMYKEIVNACMEEGINGNTEAQKIIAKAKERYLKNTRTNQPIASTSIPETDVLGMETSIYDNRHDSINLKEEL